MGLGQGLVFPSSFEFPGGANVTSPGNFQGPQHMQHPCARLPHIALLKNLLSKPLVTGLHESTSSHSLREQCPVSPCPTVFPTFCSTHSAPSPESKGHSPSLENLVSGLQEFKREFLLTTSSWQAIPTARNGCRARARTVTDGVHMHRETGF